MKGQISLDLVIAVIVVLTLLTTFFIITQDIKENYKEIFVENQLKKISSELSATITSSSSMQGLNFETKISVPKIQYDNIKYPPQITFDNNMLTTTVFLGETIINYSSNFYLPQNTNVSFNQNTLQLVIKSE